MTAKYGERTYDASYTLDPPAKRRKTRSATRTRSSAQSKARRRSTRKVTQAKRTPAFTIALVTGIVSTVGFFLVALLAMYG